MQDRTNNKNQSSQLGGMEDTLWNFFESVGKSLFLISKEIVLGITHQTMPFVNIAIGCLGLFIFFKCDWDQYIWLIFNGGEYYPQKTYGFYRWFFVSSPLWVWAMGQVFSRRKLENRMDSIFSTAGLKDRNGRTPKPLFDRYIGDGIYLMRVKRGPFPMEQYYKAKAYIESGLGIYVDDFKEDRNGGIVDIIYSRSPMPSQVHFSSNTDYELQFLVGSTRSTPVASDLMQTPHLLVAGQTGSGKSTFIRGLITSFYQNSDSMEFSLIDLKGGLEFQLFENLKRVKVIPNIERATKELKDVQMELERRMKLLKENGAKDLEDLKSMVGKEELKRKLVVVDEAAEIFLGGHHATTGELAIARKAISQIARQGRAVGVHLIMATQRPDAKAIDPQVKTNLTGIICFQMPNNVSSMTVIDSGRATHLSDIPGRALWKAGGQITELQTPYLTIDNAKSRLSKYKTKKVSGDKPKQKSIKSFDMEA